MISVQGLRKEFGELVAVDGVSFAAQPGEIFGLLGPNGAGKTTTIGCLSGLVAPTAGHVQVMGHDVVRDGRAARRALGVVPQEIALYDDLSATENLAYWGGAQGLRDPALRHRMAEVLELTGLQDRAKEPVKNFSGGMKRRLNFACGIIHQPKVLLLDEPTVGVDPQSRVRLLELVRGQAHAGACVLYTTHYMEEAESLCDRLAVIDHGKVIATGTLAELRALMGERDLLRLSGTFPQEATLAAVRGLDGVEVVQAEENLLTLSLAEACRHCSQLSPPPAPRFAKPLSPSPAWKASSSSSRAKSCASSESPSGRRGKEALPAKTKALVKSPCASDKAPSGQTRWPTLECLKEL
jgi:ABC-2 type transport system ATP-binding protein